MLELLISIVFYGIFALLLIAIIQYLVFFIWNTFRFLRDFRKSGEYYEIRKNKRKKDK